MSLLTNIPGILTNDCRMVKAVYDNSRQPGQRIDANKGLLVGLALGRILLTSAALLLLAKKGIKLSTVGGTLLCYELFGLAYNQTTMMSSNTSLSALFTNSVNLFKMGGEGAMRALGAQDADPIHPIARGTLFAPAWSALAKSCNIPIVWA